MDEGIGLTFTLQGFATHIQENVPLTVGSAVSLPVAMKVSFESSYATPL